MCCSWQNRFHKEQQKSEGLPSTNPRKMPRPDPMILAKTTASPRNGLDGCIQIIIGLFPSHIVHLAVTIEWKPLEMSYLFWAIWKKCISTFPKVPIHSCTHFQRSESASTLVSSFVHISFFKLMMSSVRFSSFSCICCKVFDTSSIQLSWFFKASWMSPISSLAVGWLKQWFFQRNRINQIFELCNCSTWRTYPPVPHGRDLSSHCGFHTLATGDNGVGSIHTSAHPWREGTEVKNGVTNNLKHLLVTSNFSASILFLGNFLAFWPLNKLCDV